MDSIRAEVEQGNPETGGVTIKFYSPDFGASQYLQLALGAPQAEQLAVSIMKQLGKDPVQKWGGLFFVTAVVCAATIGLFALPYLAMLFTPAKGC